MLLFTIEVQGLIKIPSDELFVKKLLYTGHLTRSLTHSNHSARISAQIPGHFWGII